MNKFKNLIILTLTALLGLSLFSQPAQSAPSSNAAKSIQYEMCFQFWIDDSRGLYNFLDMLGQCKEYKP